MAKKFLIFSIPILLISFSSCSENKKEAVDQPKKTYATVVVEKQSIELLSVYPTTIKGSEDIEIRPRIDGFIEEVFIDEGSAIKKGQALFKINSPKSEQTLKSARAALKSAKAQVNTALTNVNRIKPLVDKNIISQIQLTTAKDSYQSALANYEQAEAALTNAEETLSWTRVTSPVDGSIGSIPYRIGSLVSSSNVLTTVANTNNVFAYFSLNEKELDLFLNNLEGDTQAKKITNAQDVSLTLSDGEIYPYTGKIETITGRINTTTGSVTFRAEFPNKEGRLRSGASGNISLSRFLENVITIPQRATYSRQDKTLLYKVQGDSVISKVVKVIPSGKDYVVIEGLQLGDRVVTDGVATLSDRQKISFN